MIKPRRNRFHEIFLNETELFFFFSNTACHRFVMYCNTYLGGAAFWIQIGIGR